MLANMLLQGWLVAWRPHHSTVQDFNYWHQGRKRYWI